MQLMYKMHLIKDGTPTMDIKGKLSTWIYEKANTHVQKILRSNRLTVTNDYMNE